MGTENADASSLVATMQLVEQACAALQTPQDRAAAEVALLAFRKSYRPFQACQFIMEHSQMAYARFEAAAALQDSAVREWGLLTTDEKSGLRSYCLNYVMTHAASPEAYVQAKVSAVAAILMKRGWLEMVEAEKEAFFEEVRKAVSGSHGVAGQIAGISFLESLVSEFSPSTASPMGLSAEFHEHCRASLELQYLQKFYSCSLDAAFSVAEKVLTKTSSQLEIHVCERALRIMSQILTWDFQGTVVHGKNRSNAFSMTCDASGGKRGGESGTFVQPGPSWQDLLLSPNHINWILQFYARAREYNTDNSWIDSPLCTSARQLILQLCCLTGSIFPPDRGASQEQHLQRMLIGIAPWLSSPDSVITAVKSGRSESELLDGFRALGSIASLSSPTVFDNFLKPVGSTLNLLSSLTEGMIRASVVKSDEEQCWIEEGINSLLDTWTYLLQPADLSKKIPFPPSGVQAAASVFNTFVNTELTAASASADDDDESEELQSAISVRDDRLSSFALIARAAPAEALSLLVTLFSERCSFVWEQFKANRACSNAILEELHWILLVCGHVLADPGDGETPMVPEPILTHFPGCMNVESHPVVLLSRSAIRLAQISLDTSPGREFFSSRLMEALLWFFARWVDTYLLPLDSGRGPNSTPSATEGDLQQSFMTGTERNPVLVAFSEQGEGRAALECLAQVAVAALTSWPGEKALLDIACSQFLPALARRKNVCSYLVHTEAWQKLAKAFALLNENLLTLPTSIQRGVAEALCRSATGLGSADVTNQFVRDLFTPLTTKLIEISQIKDLVMFAQKPDAILLITSLMERLRGAARATMPRSQKAIFDIGAAAMEPILVFLEIYKNQPSVVYILLKYVVDWVDGQVAFLDPKETTVLFKFCVRLLQIYSTHNIGKVSVTSSRSLLAESQAEKYKDLRALLQLLTNLSSKDLIDFGTEGNSEIENPDVAQVVYLGLHIVIPLITVDLLKYPKLCRQYFTLLAHMLEVYPEKVAKLSKEGFGQIVGTLDYGLRHLDIEVVNMSLTALNAIAVYHYQAITKGEEGLGCHAGTSEENGITNGGVLAHFLRSLMQYLLFEDYSNELVDPAADALLPLVLCNTLLYQRLAEELLKEQHNAALQNRLTAAFAMLLNANNLRPSLDRANKRRFRENLHNFLSEVRGFLRVR